MDDATPERWQAIPGWEGFYEASTLGRIRSLPRKFCKGCIRKPVLMPNGYLVVGLCRAGTQKQRYVHQWVMEAFVGPCPEGQEVRHLDGNPANNALSNLRYGTPGENTEDKFRHGRVPAGAEHSCAIFTEDEVAAIRSAWSAGARGVALAAQYGVSRATVCRIVNGNAYRDPDAPKRPQERCHYPGCAEFAEAGTNSQGMPFVFCPDSAHTNASAKIERARRANQARKPRRNCLHCGTQFIANRSDKVYCTRDCKRKAYWAARKAA